VKPTYIRKRKRPSGSGLWSAYPLATDEFRQSGLLHVDVSTQPALIGSEWTESAGIVWQRR